MALISSANSIFELAFGANVVFAIILARFKKTNENVALYVAKRIAIHVPNFQLEEHEKPAFVDFAFRSIVGLRLAYWFSIITVILSLLVVTVSVVALIKSAVDPNYSLPDSVVTGFAVIGLLVCPGLYLVQEWLVDRFEGAFLARTQMDRQKAELTASSFRMIQEGRALIESTNTMIAKSEMARLSAQWMLLVHRIEWLPGYVKLVIFTRWRTLVISTTAFIDRLRRRK